MTVENSNNSDGAQETGKSDLERRKELTHNFEAKQNIKSLIVSTIIVATGMYGMEYRRGEAWEILRETQDTQEILIEVFKTLVSFGIMYKIAIFAGAKARSKNPYLRYPFE